MEGGSNVDGDESGGTSPSRQGAGTGILVPRSLMAMAAEIGIASGEKGSRIRVSGMRVKYRPKGASAEAWGAQAPPRRGQGVGARAGRLGCPWLPSVPTLVFLEASCTLIFSVFFPEFLEHF